MLRPTIALPDAVRTATERVTSDKVADGVRFIAGGYSGGLRAAVAEGAMIVT